MTEPLIVDNSKNGTTETSKSAAQIYSEDDDVETTSTQIGANNDSILSGLTRSIKADEIENDTLVDDNSDNELDNYG